jgi:cytochrome P450
VFSSSNLALTTFSLYSLSATPEYIQPIREEIRAVLAQNDGQVTFKGLQEMIKLDSYMKEVLRFYPAAGMSMLCSLEPSVCDVANYL